MQSTIPCRDRDGNIHNVAADQFRWRPGVYGVVIQDGKILLSPQWDGYDFPGGGMDMHETIEQALIREVTEETGLTVAPGEIIEVVDTFFKPVMFDEYWHGLALYYRAAVTGGTISTAGFDEHEKGYAKEAVWLPVEEAMKVKYYNQVDAPELIRKALLR